MILSSNREPHCLHQVRDKFLFFPKTLPIGNTQGTETRWLEFVKISYRWKRDLVDLKWKWIAENWED